MKETAFLTHRKLSIPRVRRAFRPQLTRRTAKSREPETIGSAPPPSRCTCAEAYYVDKQGQKTYFPGSHDCRYIARRNSLIPEAERRAHAATKTERGTLLYGQSWAKAFRAAMAELIKVETVYGA